MKKENDLPACMDTPLFSLDTLPHSPLWNEQCLKQALRFEECYPQMLTAIDNGTERLGHIWASLHQDLSDNKEALSRLNDLMQWREDKAHELKAQLRTLHEVARVICSKRIPKQLSNEELLKTRYVHSGLAKSIMENWQLMDASHMPNAVSANLCSLFSHTRAPYEREIATRQLQNLAPLPLIEHEVMKWLQECYSTSSDRLQ